MTNLYLSKVKIGFDLEDYCKTKITGISEEKFNYFTENRVMGYNLTEHSNDIIEFTMCKCVSNFKFRNLRRYFVKKENCLRILDINDKTFIVMNPSDVLKYKSEVDEFYELCGMLKEMLELDKEYTIKKLIKLKGDIKKHNFLNTKCKNNENLKNAYNHYMYCISNKEIKKKYKMNITEALNTSCKLYEVKKDELQSIINTVVRFYDV